MSDKHLCIYSQEPDCSEENLCSSCFTNKILDELAKETQELEKLFTPEQEKEIDEWLDNNKDLMDDLVKAGD